VRSTHARTDADRCAETEASSTTHAEYNDGEEVMESNGDRLALMLIAFLVLVASIAYAVREPGTQWSSFMMGAGFAALICLTIWGSEEDW